MIPALVNGQKVGFPIHKSTQQMRFEQAGLPIPTSPPSHNQDEKNFGLILNEISANLDCLPNMS